MTIIVRFLLCVKEYCGSRKIKSFLSCEISSVKMNTRRQIGGVSVLMVIIPNHKCISLSAHQNWTSKYHWTFLQKQSANVILNINRWARFHLLAVLARVS